MKDIEMDEAETALWKEVGERGEAFRRATRGRAAEQSRESGRMVEILDPDGAMMDSVASPDAAAPDPTDDGTPRLP